MSRGRGPTRPCPETTSWSSTWPLLPARRGEDRTVAERCRYRPRMRCRRCTAPWMTPLPASVNFPFMNSDALERLLPIEGDGACCIAGVDRDELEQVRVRGIVPEAGAAGARRRADLRLAGERDRAVDVEVAAALVHRILRPLGGQVPVDEDVPVDDQGAGMPLVQASRPTSVPVRARSSGSRSCRARGGRRSRGSCCGWCRCRRRRS